VSELSRLHRSGLVLLLSVALMFPVLPVEAQGMCRDSQGQGPVRRAESTVNSATLVISGGNDCKNGTKVNVSVLDSVPGKSVKPTGPSDEHSTPNVAQTGQSQLLATPIFCRRDDAIFLPPNSQGGLPCATTTTTQAQVDPLAIALQMEAAVPPPEVKIGMNPAKGLVAVPTWFWVEGYDGRVIPAAQTVVEEHEICHDTAVRDASGAPSLGGDGRPRTRRDCTIQRTTFDIGVRLWPRQFAWDFGDNHTHQTACRGFNDCGDGLGVAFRDSQHPSPIQHPYQWSSLGAGGALDAYKVQVGITFAADYFVSINGQGGQWRSLPDRQLWWATTHRVQEAQAVLTHP
jgi:hypothetical protein